MARSAAPGAELLLKKLAQKAEDIGCMSFATAMAYMRLRISRLLVRAAFHCVRGTHEKKDKTEFNRGLAFAASRRGCS